MLVMAGIVLASGIVFAEKSFSAGYEIGEIGNDLTVGGRITSPFFFGGYAALRAAGDAAWKKTDWSSYGFFRAGLVGSSGMIQDIIRLYGEGGVSLLYNEEGYRSVLWGGYGLFGFEFFTGKESPLSYFIEMGTLGTSVARLSGFSVRTGLTFYVR